MFLYAIVILVLEINRLLPIVCVPNVWRNASIEVSALLVAFCSSSPQEGFGLAVLATNFGRGIDGCRIQRIVARKIPRAFEAHAVGDCMRHKRMPEPVRADLGEGAGVRRVLAQRRRSRSGKKPLHRLDS